MEDKEESKESFRTIKNQEQLTLLKNMFPTIKEQVIAQVINNSSTTLNRP